MEEHQRDMKKDYINSQDTPNFNPYTLKIKSIDDLQLIINPEKELLYFIHSGILKTKVSMNVNAVLIYMKDKISALIHNAFYFCLFFKFPFIITDDLISPFRRNLCSMYVKIFSDITKNPKEEIILCIILMVSYITNYLFYKYLSNRQ